MPRIWLFGDDVDTDQILPGRYSPFQTSEEAFASYAFWDHRPGFSREVRPGDVLVAGRNFGCGSSREYAPRALMRLGVSGVIAASFARIFFRNVLNLGLPAFEADLRGEVQDGDPAELDARRGLLRLQGRQIQLPPPPAFVQEIMAAGGIVAYYRAHGRYPGEPR